MIVRNRNKIAVTGASGVGKTSLAELLSRHLELDLIPELSRALCIQQGYSSPVEIPDQMQFRREVLDAQILAESSLERFVADRCSVDCWVLWERWQQCSAMTYDTESYYAKCRQNACKYDSIIYVPPLFSTPEDGFRWTDKDYIRQIDRLTRLALYDWGLLDRTYTITLDGLEARVLEFMRWLDSL